MQIPIQPLERDESVAVGINMTESEFYDVARLFQEAVSELMTWTIANAVRNNKTLAGGWAVRSDMALAASDTHLVGVVPMTGALETVEVTLFLTVNGSVIPREVVKAMLQANWTSIMDRLGLRRHELLVVRDSTVDINTVALSGESLDSRIVAAASVIAALALLALVAIALIMRKRRKEREVKAVLDQLDPVGGNVYASDYWFRDDYESLSAPDSPSGEMSAENGHYESLYMCPYEKLDEQMFPVMVNPLFDGRPDAESQFSMDNVGDDPAFASNGGLRRHESVRM